MSKLQPGRGPEDPDSATRAENPEEELSTDERRISLRVKVPAEDGTAVVERRCSPHRRTSGVLAGTYVPVGLVRALARLPPEVLVYRVG